MVDVQEAILALQQSGSACGLNAAGGALVILTRFAQVGMCHKPRKMDMELCHANARKRYRTVLSDD
jgi:hypothetical protein